MRIPKVGTAVAVSFMDPLSIGSWAGGMKREDTGLDGHIQLILGFITDRGGKDIIIAPALNFSLPSKKPFDQADPWKIPKGAIRHIHTIELPPESYEE